MKLQYLGDVRDAFKWDLLHWICTRAEPPFGRLLFVPILTADDIVPRDGRITHLRFECRSEIRSLIDSLAGYPRSFEPLHTLGHIRNPHFEVALYRPKHAIESGVRRHAYWSEIGSFLTRDTLVFLDPDNGFETRTCRGTKWVRHREVQELLSHAGGVAVYQHRPLQPWAQIFSQLSAQLHYATYAAAAYEENLAFIVLAQAEGAANRVRGAMQSYVAGHGVVHFCNSCRHYPIS